MERWSCSPPNGLEASISQPGPLVQGSLVFPTCFCELQNPPEKGERKEKQAGAPGPQRRGTSGVTNATEVSSPPPRGLSELTQPCPPIRDHTSRTEGARKNLQKPREANGKVRKRLFRVRPNIYGQTAMTCGRQARIPMAGGRSTPLLSVP